MSGMTSCKLACARQVCSPLTHEHESVWRQVMEEGERLSKKQLAQESTIKKLRTQIKEGDLAKNEVVTNLAIERQKVHIPLHP